jgi:uncharacterized protein (TIGR04141 family)
VYKCVYCEVDFDCETYLLSTGKWYRIAPDFVSQVNDYVKSIPRLMTSLPAYNDHSEEAYNKRVVATDPSYHLMDQKFIHIGGGHSKVEFCDMFGSNDRELIHIKRYGGSGMLSHLFMQGLVSGQFFMSEETFRDNVNNLMPGVLGLSDIAARPDAQAYKIVYAIVSQEKGEGLTLPFFSRLSLQNASKTLKGYGYRLGLAKNSG